MDDPTHIAPRRSALLLAVLVLVLLLAACRESPPLFQEDSDPVDRIYGVQGEDGATTPFDTTGVFRRRLTRRPVKQAQRQVGDPALRLRTIHPALKAWIDARRDTLSDFFGEDTTLVLTFRDTLSMPRFPLLRRGLARTAERRAQRRVLAHELIDELKERRNRQYGPLIQLLDSLYEARVEETFWLIGGVVVRMPLHQVAALSKHPEVRSVEPRYPGEVLDALGILRNSAVAKARSLLGSNPYYGLSSERIGLLDTGVRFSHVQFDSTRLGLRRDCVKGGEDCATGNEIDPGEACGKNHGTSSSAILIANTNQGPDFRGVTQMTLDSYKVYKSKVYPSGTCKAQIDRVAAVRAFQAAIEAGDSVILAEIQSGNDENGSLAQAADRAFDAGVVVIAANGNNGTNGPGSVNEPAVAHKVIGVGAVDVESRIQDSAQSLGPAPDGRIKPDIQAPTNTETAHSDSDTTTASFSGTSGAAPYAAGVAALFRNWLRESSDTADPGHVYAHLILAGQQPYPFNDSSGAGPLRTPSPDGLRWWGKVSVEDGDVIEIPLTLRTGLSDMLDGALWWPENYDQEHNDVDLFLVDPSGAVADSSTSIPSIFERARATGSLAPGEWMLRIQGTDVPAGPQTVYWAAHAHPK